MEKQENSGLFPGLPLPAPEPEPVLSGVEWRSAPEYSRFSGR